MDTNNIIQTHYQSVKLAVALRTARSVVGWSQDELSVLSGIPKITIARFETLEGTLKAEQLMKLLDLYGSMGAKLELSEGNGFTLKFVFTSAVKVLASVNKNTFKIGCVPIINLFPKTSEPITFERRDHEYLLVPDHHKETSHEIHSIEALIASDPEAEQPQMVSNLFAAERFMDGGQEMYWTSRREQSLRPGMSGSDVFISFVDRTNISKTPAEPVLFAKLMCTNRKMAELVPSGARLIGESISSSIQVSNLYEPVSQKDALTSSKSVFSLIEILRLNHHSLIEDDSGAEKLRQLLFLFAGEAAKNQSQVRDVLPFVRCCSLRLIKNFVFAETLRNYFSVNNCHTHAVG